MTESKHRIMTRVPWLLLLILPAIGLIAANGGAPEPVKRQATIRGITISTHGSGHDWGTDAITGAMTSIKQIGATWVSTHPYARIDHDGKVSYGNRRWGRRRRAPAQPQGTVPLHWTRPVAEAHAQGLKIMIKPHLAYWGRFSWRGTIEFETDEQWDRFFDSYETWIVAVATACKDADGFVIGTELDKTIRFAERWRKIIRSVRQVTDAPLTYAANWTDYERIEFWDDLDVIGIQAYFPVAEQSAADDAQIEAGWQAVMKKLRPFAAKVGKDIVFTELGYTRSLMAPVKPWLAQEDGPEALAVQTRCMRIALQAIEHEPRVIGSFLWKWFPPPHENGRNFRLATDQMKAVISKQWDATAQ